MRRRRGRRRSFKRRRRMRRNVPSMSKGRRQRIGPRM